MTEMINLTPHKINFFSGRVVDSSGILRVDTEVVISSNIDGIDITTTEFKDSVTLNVQEDVSKGLPPAIESAIYIVSLPCAQYIAQYHPERNDFFIPGEVVRDLDGSIIGCKSLAIVKLDTGEIAWNFVQRLAKDRAFCLDSNLDMDVLWEAIGYIGSYASYIDRK